MQQRDNCRADDGPHNPESQQQPPLYRVPSDIFNSYAQQFYRYYFYQQQQQSATHVVPGSGATPRFSPQKPGRRRHSISARTFYTDSKTDRMTAMQAVPAAVLPFSPSYHQLPQLIEISTASVPFPGTMQHQQSLQHAMAAVAAAGVAPSSTHRSSPLGKSFTIEAILGLRENAVKNNNNMRTSPSHNLDQISVLHHPPHHHHHSPFAPMKDVAAEIRRKNRIMGNSPYIYAHQHQDHHRQQIQQQQSKHSTEKDLNKSSLDESISQTKPLKSKRVRTIFTPEQLERLETEFERQQYMVGPERLYLASALNLTEAQVKVWFQNRRIKWRKQHLELQQAHLAKLRDSSSDPREESEASSDDEEDE